MFFKRNSRVSLRFVLESLKTEIFRAGKFKMSNDQQKDGKKEITIALAGNPNCGKTTIFNAVTGSSKHVGNYPGVTVEKIEGTATHAGRKLHIVDLPGTYSLTAYSVDEIVARDFLLNDKPDAVIAIIDSSNLERNLYLATQLLEMDLPLVLAFNMADIAKNQGYAIDKAALSQLMGVPIVFTVGHKEKGIDELLDTALAVADDPQAYLKKQRHPTYGEEVQPHVEELTELISASCGMCYRAKWLAIKLLENDEKVIQRLNESHPESQLVLEKAAAIRQHISSICGDSPEIILADRRYGFISGACTETVKHTVESRHNLSDRIDTVLTGRWLGLPIFVVMMYLVFWLTFTVGEFPMGWIESGFHWLGGAISQLWPRGSDSLLKSLIVDGLIGGVGGVIIFLPNIFMLFLAISFLEDSGYMARAAFIMDRVMHKIGLHGRSFIPMLTGFGCSIPAILATRTLETRRDRLTTMLVIPLMSCGARLPIYALIIPAFFPKAINAPILWSIYIIGILLAVAMAKLLRSTIFKGEMVPFILELPPYRMPTLKGLLVHTWGPSWMYLRKAGTVILGLSIVLWALTTFPRKTVFDQNYDALASQARNELVTNAKSLNGVLTLDKNSQLPAQAIAIEVKRENTQEQYWPDQPEFVAAEELAQDELKKLCAQPGGEKIATFLAMREKVQKVREEFNVAVEENELDENSTKYLLAKTIRDRNLHELEEENPPAYIATVLYLDNLHAPSQAQLEKLRNRKRYEEVSYSMSGRIGRAMEPVLKPIGFDWKIGTALIGALAAKEVFVAQLGIVYSVGETDEGSQALRRQLRSHYNSLQAYCIMIFCLISAPCVATIAVTYRESGSLKWAALQLGGLTVLAYGTTLIVYQVGRLFI